MDNTRKIEFILFLAGTILAGYIYLEDRHASKQALIQTEFELKEELYDDQAKRYAETADYYRRLEAERDLEPLEKERKNYTAKQAVLKQSKVEKIQDTLTDLETK